MPDSEKIIELLSRYLTGCLDEEGRAGLEAWIGKKKENRLFFERLCSRNDFARLWKQRSSIDVGRALARFEQRCPGRRKARTLRYVVRSAFAAAAAVAVYFAVTLLTVQSGSVGTVLPGAGGKGTGETVLVLDNGEEIVLGREEGVNVQFDAVDFTDSREKLVYLPKSDTIDSASEIEYNEIRVPRGGEYQLVLSDGTQVFLNSASTFRYPVRFGNGRRDVCFSGEAYFKVAKSGTPFRIRTEGMMVQVYGTSFNLNTYFPDRVQTALVEGRVGIWPDGTGQEHVLSPSEVAELDIRTGKLEIRHEPLDRYLAWTRNLMVFDNETLEEIAYRIGIWYDLNVFFQNPSLKELHFTGVFRRYDDIDILLEGLSRGTDARFGIQGKTLVIYRK